MRRGRKPGPPGAAMTEVLPAMRIDPAVYSGIEAFRARLVEERKEPVTFAQAARAILRIGLERAKAN